MIIDFSQVLKTLRGEPIRQFIFETAVLDLARQRGGAPRTVGEAADLLDAAGIKVRDILNHLGEEFALRDACSSALHVRAEQPGPGEKKDTPKDANEKYHLSQRIYGAKESLKISVEENALIQRALMKTDYNGLIVGQAIDMLEAGSPDPKEPAATIPAGKPEK